MRTNQINKVIMFMARRADQEWFNAIDFQSLTTDTDCFVGYEASARISELVKRYPNLVDVAYEGRYRYVKLKPLDKVLADLTLPSFIKDIIRTERGVLL